MDIQLAFLFVLTFVIHLIATLAYSVRIAGARTGRIAVSLALFNILVLVSRTSNSFQAPMLAKRVERNLLHGHVSAAAASDFRWLLLAATLATAVGALLIPTFQRVFGRAVVAFAAYRSVARLLLHACSKAGLSYIRDSVRMPARENITQLASRRLPAGVIASNVIATAVATVGVFASLYAGYLNPALRVTASNLSAVVNGLATIVMFVFIDPYLSILTDDVMDGKVSEPYFRRAVVWMVGSRFAGTVLAQMFLIPASSLIVAAAERL